MGETERKQRKQARDKRHEAQLKNSQAKQLDIKLKKGVSPAVLKAREVIIGKPLRYCVETNSPQSESRF